MASSIFVTNVVDQFRPAEIEITSDGHLLVKDQGVVSTVSALLTEGRPISLIIATSKKEEQALESTDTTPSISRKTNMVGC